MQKSGGRVALADIVTEVQLPDGIVCNSTLWAACIGGAMQRDDYRSAIEAAGLRIRTVRDNPSYRFISDTAPAAALYEAERFAIKSGREFVDVDGDYPRLPDNPVGACPSGST